MATYSSIFLFVALGVVICLGRIGALTEQEVGVDGMRCDSCGMECSNMCGSRSFRICCLNYVKKRSGGGEAALGVELEGGGPRGPGRQGAVTQKGGLERLAAGGRLRKLLGGGDGSNGGGGGMYLPDPQWILVSSPAVAVRQGVGSHDKQDAEEGVMRQVYSRMI